jgi:hypothetical protein
VSAPKVDVMTWFDDYIRRCGIYDDGTPIRAAVAELIEAAQPAISEEGMTQDELNRLRAALVSIGGES